MMPKLIALARRRTSAGMSSTGTPNISDAVMAWMSRPSAKALRELRDVGDVGQHAQLDLAVVGRDQLVPALGDEGRADLAALLGADRDVLQVGVGRGEAPRRRGGQRVGRVDAARLGIDVLGQRIRIGRPELRQLPPLEHHVDELGAPAPAGPRWPARSSSRLARVSHWPDLGPAAAGQLQTVEQELAELLRRAQIELVAGQRRRSPPPAGRCAGRTSRSAATGSTCRP